MFHSKSVTSSLISILALCASACADGGPEPDPVGNAGSSAGGDGASISVGGSGAADGTGGHAAGHAGGQGGTHGVDPEGGADDGGDNEGGADTGGAAEGGSHDGHAAGSSQGSGATGGSDAPGSGAAGGSPSSGGSSATGGGSHEGHGGTSAAGGDTSATGGSSTAGTAGSSEEAGGSSSVAGTSSHGHGGVSGAAAGGAGSGGSPPASGGASSGGGMGATSGMDHGGSSHGGTSASGSGGDSGNSGTAGSAGTANTGGSGGSAHAHDHCVDGDRPDPRDALLATPSAPDIFVASNGAVDLPLPEPILEWMDDRIWKLSHDAWHNIRRCSRGSQPGGEGSSTGSAAMCAHTELVPADQECENAANGYEFLVMHRHMLNALRQSFPNHADLFDGFPHFPFEAEDVPEAWQDRFGSGWSQSVLSTASILEDVENNLERFPTEGDLGKYIQCGMSGNGGASIHGAMHFKWVVNESPNSLGKQNANLGNYMFWKLHGWIDGIWERYRVAKGLPPDEPALVAELVAQCREMHALGEVIEPSAPEQPLPQEFGYFHETVRPALERLCSGCHDEASPPANMSLGGHISSANIVANLVNVQSARGGQYVRVAPGHPELSWLYLKASGLAASAGCVGSDCNSQSMPPGATDDQRLTALELGAIEQWILDGAPAPTQ